MCVYIQVIFQNSGHCKEATVPALFTFVNGPIPTMKNYNPLDNRDFPGGTVVKNPPANAGDTGSSPGPGRSHMRRSN